MKRWLFALAAAAVVFTGCNVIPPPAPDPTRYFVLSDAAPTDAPIARAADGLIVGLRTLDLPSYLKSRSIIVRNNANEVAYQDYARWAEPLDAGLGRTVRLRLQDAENVTRVYREPFPFDLDRDYDLAVRIVRCEGAVTKGQGKARLAAAFEIINVPENRVVVRRFFNAPEAAWDGHDFGALARLLSEAALALGDAIDAELAKLPKPARRART